MAGGEHDRSLSQLLSKLNVGDDVIEILKEQDLLDERVLQALTDEEIKGLGLNLGKQKKLQQLRIELQGSSENGAKKVDVISQTGHTFAKTSGIAASLQGSADDSGAGHSYSSGNFQRMNIDGPLTIFQPRLKEFFVDKDMKIRVLAFGNPDPGADTKNLMVIGETGSGKSTFIDCFFNNLLGVEYDDNVRLRLVTLAPEEEENMKRGQSTSQTEWITIYYIGRGPYHTIPENIIIVDTPGFGDTRGLERDERLNVQIRSFFNIASPKLGIELMHAICFIIKASATRLTAAQSYIFDSVLSIFGKDIADAIFLCCTHADFNDKTPGAVNVCRDDKVPFNHYFRFQNSAYFNPERSSRLKLDWDDGEHGYRDIMDVLQMTKPVGLARTVEVNQQRGLFLKQMRFVEECMRETTTKLDAKQKREEALKDPNTRSYKIFKHTKQRVFLKDGEEATNCQKCNATCCYPCTVPKGQYWSYMCEQTTWAGFCNSCDCWFRDHQKEKWKIELAIAEEEEVISLEESARRDELINKLHTDIKMLEEKLQQELVKAAECQTLLRKIALKSEVFTPENYIDLLIEGEKSKGSRDATERIKRYEELKRNQKFMKELIGKAAGKAASKIFAMAVDKVGSVVLGLVGL